MHRFACWIALLAAAPPRPWPPKNGDQVHIRGAALKAAVRAARAE